MATRPAGKKPIVTSIDHKNEARLWALLDAIQNANKTYPEKKPGQTKAPSPRKPMGSKVINGLLRSILVTASPETIQRIVNEAAKVGGEESKWVSSIIEARTIANQATIPTDPADQKAALEALKAANPDLFDEVAAA